MRAELAGNVTVGLDVTGMLYRPAYIRYTLNAVLPTAVTKALGTVVQVTLVALAAVTVQSP